MPSSKKTPRYRLNQWLGSDKPKKDDFNEDNEIVDQALGALREALDSAVTGSESGLSQAREEWQRDLAEATEELAGEVAAAGEEARQAVAGVAGDLEAHTGNGDIHITPGERTAWNNSGPTIITYNGDGSRSRTISLGYTPKAGFVYAQGRPPVNTAWLSQNCYVWFAAFSPQGSGGGAALREGGLVLTNDPADNPEGFQYKLNEEGYAYVVMLWR